MDRTKLEKKLFAADHRVTLALAELDALVDRKKVTKTFQAVLRNAVQSFQKESTALIRALDKAERDRWAELAGRKRQYVHNRGRSMPATGEVKQFRQVYVSYSDPKPNGYEGEWLWARKIGADTAILDNIPYFCPRLGLGDLVRVNKKGVVMEVLEHGARTRQLNFAEPTKHTEGQLQKRYAAVREKMESYDIVTEMMGPGLACLSVPEDLEDSQVALLAEQMGAQMVKIDSETQGPQEILGS